jgi:hypothetical protein
MVLSEHRILHTGGACEYLGRSRRGRVCLQQFFLPRVNPLSLQFSIPVVPFASGAFACPRFFRPHGRVASLPGAIAKLPRQQEGA